MTLQPAVVRQYLAGAQQAATSDAKGKLYEELVKYLFEAVAGCIAERNLTNIFRTEQIDVAVGNARLVGGLWLLPHVILVECKDWDKPVDSGTVGYLLPVTRFERGWSGERHLCWARLVVLAGGSLSAGAPAG
jgi:hypothetical protein